MRRVARSASADANHLLRVLPDLPEILQEVSFGSHFLCLGHFLVQVGDAQVDGDGLVGKCHGGVQVLHGLLEALLEGRQLDDLIHLLEALQTSRHLVVNGRRMLHVCVVQQFSSNALEVLVVDIGILIFAQVPDKRHNPLGEAMVNGRSGLACALQA